MMIGTKMVAVRLKDRDRDKKHFRLGDRLTMRVKEIEVCKSMARSWFGRLGRL